MSIGSIRSKFACLAIADAIAGCAAKPRNPVNPNDASMSLVFLYFDSSDAPSNLEWSSLERHDGDQARSRPDGGRSLRARSTSRRSSYRR